MNFLQWNDQCKHDECMHYYFCVATLHWLTTNTDRWRKEDKPKSNRRKTKKKKKFKICATRKLLSMKIKLNGAVSMALGVNSFLGFWHCNQYMIYCSWAFSTLNKSKITQKWKIKTRILYVRRKKYFGICGFVEILLLNAIEHSATFHLYTRRRKTTISHTNTHSTHYFWFYLMKIIRGLMTSCKCKQKWATVFMKYKRSRTEPPNVPHNATHSSRAEDRIPEHDWMTPKSTLDIYISGQERKKNQTAVRGDGIVSAFSGRWWFLWRHHITGRVCKLNGRLNS